MKLEYDAEFVEGAAFVFANRRRPPAPPALQVRRFHAAREKLYSILDPDERDAAFFKLHLEWFREWGLEKSLLEPADELPLFRTALTALIFRKARVKTDEGAELYVSPENGRSGVVALRVERFEQSDEMATFLRHEFMHLHDMLDPAFGYSPQLHLPGQNPAQQRLTRERYRLLWSIATDGRLTNTRGVGIMAREQHRTAFDRTFNFWPETRREEVFDSLWNEARPRHQALLAIASDPRDLQETQGPLPGSPCPLCGFPTFKWVLQDDIQPKLANVVSTEFPHWTLAQGLCNRCHDVYKILSSSAKPDGEPIS